MYFSFSFKRLIEVIVNSLADTYFALFSGVIIDWSKSFSDGKNAKLRTYLEKKMQDNARYYRGKQAEDLEGTRTLKIKEHVSSFNFYYFYYLLTFIFVAAAPHEQFRGIMLQFDLFICPGAKPSTRPDNKAMPGTLRWVPELDCWKTSKFRNVKNLDIFTDIDVSFCRATNDDAYKTQFYLTVKDMEAAEKYLSKMFEFFETLSSEKDRFHNLLYNAYTKNNRGRIQKVRNKNQHFFTAPEKHYATWINEVFSSKVNLFHVVVT